MAAPASLESALESVLALDGSDQRQLLQNLLKHLLGKAPRKGGAAKRAAAGGAGGGGSWWTAATKRASTVVAPLRDAENAKLSAAGKKKLPGTVAVVVLSKLKEAGKVTKEGGFPSDEELHAAFATYLDSHEPEDAKSVASKGSKGSAASKGPKFSELSPEEQKARRSAAAKAAAATRKAKKAEAAGGGGAAAGGAKPAAAESDDEEDEKPVYEKRKIGKSEYLVLERGGLTHVLDLDETWLGVLVGKKIVKEGYESPFAEDD